MTPPFKKKVFIPKEILQFPEKYKYLNYSSLLKQVKYYLFLTKRTVLTLDNLEKKKFPHCS